MIRIYCLTLALIFCLKPNTLLAQLEYIPDVSAEITGKENLSGIFIFSTIDNHGRFGAPARYPATLQIINPLDPWPPIYFANIRPKDMESGLFLDVRFQNAIGNFSFFKKSSAKSTGTFYISDTNFVIIDSFAANGRIDGHAFDVSSQGEYLYMTDMDTILNLASYCGNAADTAVPLLAQLIQITGRDGKLVFSWNPFEHLPFSDTNLPCCRIQAVGAEKGWNWSHANSLRFALDGNILYSYRFLGAGKINRKTGELMWKLGGKTPTIPIPPGGEYYDQHDFHEIAPGIYSIFSCGDEEQTSRAIIYRINEQSSKAEIVKIVEPSAAVYTLGTGNYEICENGLFLFSYGRYACMEERQIFFEVTDASGMVQAKYYLPCLNSSFQVHHFAKWTPEQPTIINTSGILALSKPYSLVSWYEMVDSKVIHLSDELTFKPSKKGKYVATARKGFGWIVSTPFNY